MFCHPLFELCRVSRDDVASEVGKLCFYLVAVQLGLYQLGNQVNGFWRDEVTSEATQNGLLTLTQNAGFQRRELAS